MSQLQFRWPHTSAATSLTFPAVQWAWTMATFRWIMHRVDGDIAFHPAPEVISASTCVQRKVHAMHNSITATPDTWTEKFESFERTNSMREANRSFCSCNSCKRLGTSESKLPFVSRIEFICSKLLNFSAHVSGVIERNCRWPNFPAERGLTRLCDILTPDTWA